MSARTLALGRLESALLACLLAASSAICASPLRLLAGPSVPQDRPLLPTGGGTPGFAARMAPFQTDTLEVFAFLAEFQKESSDNSQTTGNGTFGSDSSTRTPLEPHRARRDSTRSHYLRVFQGVSEYWRTASGGKLEVVFRVFPEASGAKPYQLPNPMGSYSPVGPASGQSQASFDSTYVVRIMEMIADGARQAASDPAGPFSAGKPSSLHRSRAYMMIHAGSSRSSDGGEKGASAANTRADIGDFAVGPSDFSYLRIRNRVRNPAYLKDSLGVVLDTTAGGTGPAAIDTLKNLLVMAETATQDGMNWGVRGTAANLVGRALGLPDLYDTWRGMSVMGRFCLMDWAGSYLGRNSTPALPSAWPRLFLGWATPIEAKPGAASFRLPAVRPGHDTVLVVRINDGEYLLVENRQRTDFSGKVSITTSGLAGSDSVTWKVSPDSLDSLLKDTSKVRGYVIGSSPDAGLPGSGLLVWHVNEWLLRELVRSGAPNSYLGDTLSDRYKGVTLVQASGKSSLGQVFQGLAGSASDVGSGGDILPHVRRSSGRTDTVTAIGPDGYATTGSLLGGRSMVTLRAPWPGGALPQRGVTSLEGDSVWTPGAASIEIRVDWNSLRAASDAYPARLPPAWGEQALLPGPASLPKSVWVLDTAGRSHLLDSTGAHWFAAKDTLRLAGAWDSTPTAFQTRPQLDTTLVPMARIGKPTGRPVQSAALVDTLAIRDRDGIVHLKWPASGAFDAPNRDSARFSDTALAGRFSAGPVVVGGSFWVGDSAGRILSLGSAGTTVPRSTGLGRIVSLCATAREGHLAIAAVDSTGSVTVVEAASGTTTRFTAGSFSPEAGETFQVLSTDFDRDGVADIAVVGSFGEAILWSGATLSPFPGWPRKFERGAGRIGEPGSAALGDLDGDGRPELVFGGTDRIFVVDASGVPAKGWPVRVVPTESVGQSTSSRPYPAGIVGASPLVADLDKSGTPEIVVGTSNGQIRAWTAAGKPFGGEALAKTSGSGVSASYQQTRWPLAAGGQVLDSTRPPYLPLAFPSGKADRLLALSSLASLDGFRIVGGTAAWPLALGGAGRTGYLPDSLLAAPSERKAGVSDFHLFPSPVRKGNATFRYELGRDASRVRLTVYDQTGFQMMDRNDLPKTAGRRDLALQAVAWGTGVYAARLQVDWAGGGSDEAWVRFGVVK